MSEFHDPDLRHELGRLSGPYPDDNAAFAAWQRRVGQARRRRAIAWTTGAAMSLIVGVVAIAAAQGQNGHSLVPQKATDTTEKITTTTAPTVTTAPVKRIIVTESTDESTTSTSATMAPDTTPSPEVVDVTLPQPEVGDAGGAAPVVTTHKAKPGSSGPGTTAAPPPPETTPTTESDNSHDTTKTFTSIGGTVTVHLFGNHLSIVDVTPAEGFDDHESGHSGHGIGVTFNSDSHRSEISVWIDHGTMKNFVSEKDETHGRSGPPDTSNSYDGGGGGHGG